METKPAAPQTDSGNGRSGARHAALPVKRSVTWAGIALALAGCGRLDAILYSPRQTPESWLSIQPHAEFQIGSASVLVVQPSTSAIVYLLGVVTVGAGAHFLRIRNGQKSRVWWGIALLLWGLGALLAGTSYEAFSYQIKCLGREACVWTSGWEIAYLIASAASVDAMLVAQAYACAAGRLRAALAAYAAANLGLYAAAVLAGALVPVQLLVSFELLLIVTAPSVGLFIALNGWRYRRSRRPMDLALLGAWAWLALTIGAYFVYLISGLTQRLWARGLWFSENDVLHLGLLAWMLYLAREVAPRLEDERADLPPAPG